MAVKPISVEGEATATPGTALFTGASSGTWAAGPLVETKYAPFTIGGKKVIHEVSCLFTFTGDGSGTSLVTLTASGTTAQSGLDLVLVDGDSEKDSFDNEISVSSSGPGQSDKS